MKALVSIITVNYNGLRDTCEMIDSFRSRETYPRYEIIVVDNGSRLPEAEAACLLGTHGARAYAASLRLKPFEGTVFRL